MKFYKYIAGLLLLVTGFAVAQTPPIGACVDNVAQTISNGVLVPVPFAQVYLCPAGSSAPSCLATTTTIYTTTALNVTTLNPQTADAGGNFFFCAPVGHYTLEVVGSIGAYLVPDISLVDDWSKGGYVTGNWHVSGTIFGNLTGNVTGNATTASASDHTPTLCNPATQFAYGVGTAWAAQCANFPAAVTPFYQTEIFNGVPAVQQTSTSYTQRFSFNNGAGTTNIDLNTTGNENKVVSAPNNGTNGDCMRWNANGGAGDTGTPCFSKTPTGSEADVVTAPGPGSSGNCGQWNGSGGMGDSGSPCGTVAAGTQVDVTGSRSFGSTYQNTGSTLRYVEGYGNTSGSSTGNLRCLTGAGSPSVTVWGNSVTATVSSGLAGFSCIVPAGYFYAITVAGDVTGVVRWVETNF